MQRNSESGGLAAARPEAYIMLSRPLEGEICFACPSQLPDE